MLLTPNTILTAALVPITGVYVLLTYRLQKDTRRQADIAQESLAGLRKREVAREEIGRMIVANTPQSAKAKVRYWKKANIPNLAATRRLPQALGPVPDQAGSALEHARLLSKEASGHLRNALDFLLFAQVELEMVRDARETGGDFYQKYTNSALDWLEKADEGIRLTIHELVNSDKERESREGEGKWKSFRRPRRKNRQAIS